MDQCELVTHKWILRDNHYHHHERTKTKSTISHSTSPCAHMDIAKSHHVAQTCLNSGAHIWLCGDRTVVGLEVKLQPIAWESTLLMMAKGAASLSFIIIQIIQPLWLFPSSPTSVTNRQGDMVMYLEKLLLRDSPYTTNIIIAFARACICFPRGLLNIRSIGGQER